MKVAVIVPAIRELGPILAIQSLVNSLSENKYLNLKLFYLDKEVDNSMIFKIPVERLQRDKFMFNEYDIIHTNGIRPDLFAFINRKKIKYHISTIHNFVFEDLTYTYNKIFSLIFGNFWLNLWKRADKLVCISEVMKDYYKKWFASSRLEMIHYGFTEVYNIIPDDDIVQVIKKFHSKGLKVIGTACILTKRKGIDQLLKMMIDEKEFSLVIIGNGKEQDNLHRLAEQLNISERCFFTGFRSNAVIYFRYFDFIAFPSRSEGFGRVLIEATQQKVPVICSDIPVFKELLNNSEATFFKLDNIDSLRAAFREAFLNGSEKSELAYSRYLSCYSDKQMSQKYLELYKSVSFSSKCLASSFLSLFLTFVL